VTDGAHRLPLPSCHHGNLALVSWPSIIEWSCCSCTHQLVCQLKFNLSACSLHFKSHLKNSVYIVLSKTHSA
jgi:hypothetical protein